MTFVTFDNAYCCVVCDDSIGRHTVIYQAKLIGQQSPLLLHLLVSCIVHVQTNLHMWRSPCCALNNVSSREQHTFHFKFYDPESSHSSQGLSVHRRGVGSHQDLSGTGYTVRNREYKGVEIDHGRGPPQARPAWRARFRGSGRPDFEPIGALSLVVGGVPGRRLAASGWTKRSYCVLTYPSSHCRASRNPRRGNSCQLSHGRGLRRHALAFLSRAGVLLFPFPAPDRS